ncbi:DUF397 domain-containing protein [Streptomyces sp. NRRL F-5630]|uniref:DUF397 domain-containing protein n=1 Tax=Streptomyces sp. NRRL F-5630 TaxID=1463864 RepID=UPI003D7506D6
MKSSHCDTGNCVEAAATRAGVLVRDSKAETGPHLDLAPGVWASFTAWTRTT